MPRRRASLFVIAFGACIALAAQLAGNAALEFGGRVAALEVVNKLATGCNPVGRRVTTLGSGDALLTSLSGASNSSIATKTVAYDVDGWTGSDVDRGSVSALTGSSWGVTSAGADATITYGQSVQKQTISGGSATWTSAGVVDTSAALAGYNDVLVIGGRTWITYVKDGALRVGWRASGDANFTTAALPGAVAAPSFGGAIVPYTRTYIESSTTYTSEVAVVYPTGSDGDTLRVTSVDPSGSGHLTTEGEHTFADSPSLPSAVSVDDDEVHAVVSVDGDVVALAGIWDGVAEQLDFTATTLSTDDVEVPAGARARARRR